MELEKELLKSEIYSLNELELINNQKIILCELSGKLKILKNITMCERQSKDNKSEKGDTEKLIYCNHTISKRNDRKGYFTRISINGKQKSIYGATTKEVIKKLQEIKKEKTQTQKLIKKYTLLEWYNIFIELYKKHQVKDTTLKSFEYDFKKFSCLHNKNIEDIKPIEIQNELNKIPYPSTQIRLHIFLNSIFEKAVLNEIIIKNPMKAVIKPKYKAAQKCALTHNEEFEFIRCASQHKYGKYFLICLYQGLRKGEARALKVNDIDFNENTLRIDESLNTHTTRTTTKNLQSMRTIPLFSKAKEILKELVKGKKQNELIFNIGQHRVDKAIAQICESANIKHISTHILRHTFITRCQELNIPTYIIQQWVGHEKGSVVTTKIYTHLNNETNLQYAKVFDTNFDTKN